MYFFNNFFDIKKYKPDQLLHSIYQYSCLVDFLPNLIPKLYILKRQKKRTPHKMSFLSYM